MGFNFSKATTASSKIADTSGNYTVTDIKISNGEYGQKLSVQLTNKEGQQCYLRLSEGSREQLVVFGYFLEYSEAGFAGLRKLEPIVPQGFPKNWEKMSREAQISWIQQANLPEEFKTVSLPFQRDEETGNQMLIPLSGVRGIGGKVADTAKAFEAIAEDISKVVNNEVFVVLRKGKVAGIKPAITKKRRAGLL